MPGPALVAHPTLADRRVLLVASPVNAARLAEVDPPLRAVFPELRMAAPASLYDLATVVLASHGSADLVLAYGGDGTLHRVLQHIDPARQTLGLLPGGTGNDLARTLGYPDDLPGRIAHLQTLAARPMDLLVFDGIRCHNSAGLGIDAATLRVREARHGLFRSNYNLAFVAALAGLRPLSAELDIDGTVRRGRFWWLLGMNNSDIGKGTQIAPGARIDDGLLDFLAVEAMSRLALLRLLPLATRGEHIGHPRIGYQPARRVSIRLGEPAGHLACDGELYPSDRRELALEVHPAALTMLR